MGVKNRAEHGEVDCFIFIFWLLSYFYTETSGICYISKQFKNKTKSIWVVYVSPDHIESYWLGLGTVHMWTNTGTGVDTRSSVPNPTTDSKRVVTSEYSAGVWGRGVCEEETVTHTACSSSSKPILSDMFFRTPMVPDTSSSCSSCFSDMNW